MNEEEKRPPDFDLFQLKDQVRDRLNQILSPLIAPCDQKIETLKEETKLQYERLQTELQKQEKTQNKTGTDIADAIITGFDRIAAQYESNFGVLLTEYNHKMADRETAEKNVSALLNTLIAEFKTHHESSIKTLMAELHRSKQQLFLAMLSGFVITIAFLAFLIKITLAR